MAIPSTSHGIIINYQNLEHLNPINKENIRTQPRTQTTPQKNIEPPMTIDSLNSQLRDLQKIVDQQAEEIRRLQNTSGQ
ncbi:hypothetical protein [Candidatus Nitrospira allomarina]|uniref:Uncharacterized protein n=1 Tax=Candidatus Nitrospira allomarina TaxID=3020900 RepID=A0AA96G8Z7_9BACT|nr:hypothetical protein [Candidatus Nitrospira allomarina]WNM57002.1 hypothetical protein PP769_13580 [Candidatus Nitrospira allomarina]